MCVEMIMHECEYLYASARLQLSEFILGLDLLWAGKLYVFTSHTHPSAEAPSSDCRHHYSRLCHVTECLCCN